MGPAYLQKASAKLQILLNFTNNIRIFVCLIYKIYRMKNSGLFIGLGVGLLVGAAIGLYIATGDDKKAELMDEIKSKADDAKKSIGKVLKQGMEELDNAVDAVKQTAQDAISKMKTKSAPEPEMV